MPNKCKICRLVNFPTVTECARCGNSLVHIAYATPMAKKQNGIVRTIVRRFLILLAVSVMILAGFYVSLVVSARSVSYQDRKTVEGAIEVLRERGFNDEVFLLEHIAIYRSSDNWLNATVAKENAYAATNFPFEILTLYPDFFAYPVDDTERAAILLHEAKHLAGKDEHFAYEYVWRNRRKLGWTADNYDTSPVWQGVRKQTQDAVPELFACGNVDEGDCTK